MHCRDYLRGAASLSVSSLWIPRGAVPCPWAPSIKSASTPRRSVARESRFAPRQGSSIFRASERRRANSSGYQRRTAMPHMMELTTGPGSPAVNRTSTPVGRRPETGPSYSSLPGRPSSTVTQHPSTSARSVTVSAAAACGRTRDLVPVRAFPVRKELVDEYSRSLPGYWTGSCGVSISRFLLPLGSLLACRDRLLRRRPETDASTARRCVRLRPGQNTQDQGSLIRLVGLCFMATARLSVIP